jgi:hypothetical protein
MLIMEEQFIVINHTDMCLASQLTFNREDGNQFITDFKKAFEQQGYYRIKTGTIISLRELVLKLERVADEIPETEFFSIDELNENE